VHRYDLRIETKKTDLEMECEQLIMKQLHLFFFILLNADKEIIIPPYLVGDRAAAGLKDLLDKFNVTQVKGMASIKRYFHRLFPRAEGSLFYCNVILASNQRPEELVDRISLV
jgi:hypothetical protein